MRKSCLDNLCYHINVGTIKKTKRQKKFKDTSYYFDDCAICQYTKQMDEKGSPQTESGLKVAFEKQRQKGAVVGGTAFDREETRN